MGYNIGLRMIEDYLAKSNTMRRCANFRETAEMIAKARPLFCTVHLIPCLHCLLSGRLQDLPKHHTHHNELDERLEAVLARLRREPASRLRGAARRRPRPGRAVVLQHLLRRAAGRPGNGADPGRGALHQRRAAGE